MCRSMEKEHRVCHSCGKNLGPYGIVGETQDGALRAKSNGMIIVDSIEVCTPNCEAPPT